MTDVSVEKKRQHELDTVSLMINIYCLQQKDFALPARN